MTAIRNVSRVAITVQLDHPAFHNKAHGFTRRTVSFSRHNPETGEVGIVEKKHSTPGSLTILAGETSKDLHPAIRNCAQVRALLARRPAPIQLVEKASPAPAAPAKPSVAARKVVEKKDGDR